MEEESKFWWESIAGPQTFISSLVRCLSDGKMLVLQIPEDLPWRHEMRNVAITAFKEQHFAETAIYTIDANDEISDEDIGSYLLKRFAAGNSQVVNGYRSRSGISIQDYLIRHKVLTKCVLWIKGIQESCSTWLKFCRDYNSHSLEEGIFVLELSDTFSSSTIGSLSVLSFAQYASLANLQVFNDFLLSKQEGLSNRWKKYIATVAAILCGFDAELSASLLRCPWKKEDIFQILHTAEQNPRFFRRGTGREHPLYCLRFGLKNELENRIWTAQVQVLFPLIEMERRSFISKYSAQLEKILSTFPIEQFHQEIRDPKDLELGSLIYLLTQRTHFGERAFFLEDEATRNRLHLLHECRNHLAHGQCCNRDEVEKILGE